MWKTEGMIGFFKGNGMNIIKIVPFSALEFYSYEIFKTKLYPHINNKDLSYF